MTTPAHPEADAERERVEAAFQFWAEGDANEDEERGFFAGYAATATLRARLAAAEAEARHRALVDAVAAIEQLGRGCDCNFAPCRHDAIRSRVMAVIAELDVDYNKPTEE
jgi:hypothetical protein